MKRVAMFAGLIACGGGLPQLAADASAIDAPLDGAEQDVPGSPDASTHDAPADVGTVDRQADVGTLPDAGPPNPPPRGTCGHSLCSVGFYLQEGCDTDQCTTLICDPNFLGDSYCCTQMWDMTCVNEVAAECSPYHCN